MVFTMTDWDAGALQHCPGVRCGANRLAIEWPMGFVEGSNQSDRRRGSEGVVKGGGHRLAECRFQGTLRSTTQMRLSLTETPILSIAFWRTNADRILETKAPWMNFDGIEKSQKYVSIVIAGETDRVTIRKGRHLRDSPAQPGVIRNPARAPAV